MITSATPCVLDDCTDPSHIVLFAQRISYQLTWPLATLGRLREGQALGFCLRHGGDILDAIQGRRDIWDLKRWVMEPGWDLTDMPTVWARHHIQPGQRVAPWHRVPRDRRMGADRPSTKNTTDRRAS
jgi:hypothetical protein